MKATDVRPVALRDSGARFTPSTPSLHASRSTLARSSSARVHGSPRCDRRIGTVTSVKSRGTAPSRSSFQPIGVDTVAEDVGRAE